MTDQTVGPPKLINSLSEFARTAFELSLLEKAFKPLVWLAPFKKPRVILVFPGFGATDATTFVLRRFLKEKGHHAYEWDTGVNLGPSETLIKHLKTRLDEISRLHPKEKVTLIGHSLGGIYARELARAFPDQIHQVITLGTPFGSALLPESTHPLVRKAFALVNGKNHPFLANPDLAEQSLIPPDGIPTTSIYSRTDGVVSWQASINPATRLSENVEVVSSHCGLVVNPLSLFVIADRLCQSQRGWKPFEMSGTRGYFFRATQAHHDYVPPAVKPNGRALVNIFETVPA